MKTLDISEDVINKVKATDRMKESIGEDIANILISYSERMEDARNEVWNSLAKKFGYKNLADLSAQGYQLKVDFITEQVTLYEDINDKIQDAFEYLMETLTKGKREELASKVRLLFTEV